ncbi:MAG: 1,6-anhydro-N-acetylmuramyl-L-alanine amidase AmpD [Gammaproteobacteria bacterium]|nr:1,6-anhydro-N-acetylmuramyl-L-alanine amidase AmpD [Gammaproteobacteria bacterium]
MTATIEGGWLSIAHVVESPNCDDRPQGSDIELLVIHGISLPPGQFGGPWIEQFFTNNLNANDHPYFVEIQDLRVSAHLLIRRNGDLIQFVPLDKRAWHAGESCFAGKQACNDFSIGIELEGCDELPYEEAQYECLADVIKVITSEHPKIGVENIVGHNQIAPGRKTDPGPAFDWQRLRALLNQ